jgi:hypothetical protein
LDLFIEISDEHDKDSRIMKSLFDFILKLKDHSKKQKGFKTNSVAVK